MGQLVEMERQRGEMTKKQRILKSFYDKGIMGVDGPTDKNSLLYKQRSQNLIRKEKKRETHKLKRQISKLLPNLKK